MKLEDSREITAAEYAIEEVLENLQTRTGARIVRIELGRKERRFAHGLVQRDYPAITLRTEIDFL